MLATITQSDLVIAVLVLLAVAVFIWIGKAVR